MFLALFFLLMVVVAWGVMDHFQNMEPPPPQDPVPVVKTGNSAPAFPEVPSATKDLISNERPLR
jgi:hypothetical protein